MAVRSCCVVRADACLGCDRENGHCELCDLGYVVDWAGTLGCTPGASYSPTGSPTTTAPSAMPSPSPTATPSKFPSATPTTAAAEHDSSSFDASGADSGGGNAGLYAGLAAVACVFLAVSVLVWRRRSHASKTKKATTPPMINPAFTTPSLCSVRAEDESEDESEDAPYGVFITDGFNPAASSLPPPLPELLPRGHRAESQIDAGNSATDFGSDSDTPGASCGDNASPRRAAYTGLDGRHNLYGEAGQSAQARPAAITGSAAIERLGALQDPRRQLDGLNGMYVEGSFSPRLDVSEWVGAQQGLDHHDSTTTVVFTVASSAASFVGAAAGASVTTAAASGTGAGDSSDACGHAASDSVAPEVDETTKERKARVKTAKRNRAREKVALEKTCKAAKKIRKKAEKQPRENCPTADTGPALQNYAVALAADGVVPQGAGYAAPQADGVVPQGAGYAAPQPGDDRGSYAVALQRTPLVAYAEVDEGGPSSAPGGPSSAPLAADASMVMSAGTQLPRPQYAVPQPVVDPDPEPPAAAASEGPLYGLGGVVRVPDRLVVSASHLELWHQTPLPRGDAAKALHLAGEGVGSFCIREGSTGGKVLMVLLPGQNNFGNFRIDEAANGSVEINDLAATTGVTFPSLVEAVRLLRDVGLGAKLGSSDGPSFRLTTCIPHPAGSRPEQPNDRDSSSQLDRDSWNTAPGNPGNPFGKPLGKPRALYTNVDAEAIREAEKLSASQC